MSSQILQAWLVTSQIASEANPVPIINSRECDVETWSLKHMNTESGLYSDTCCPAVDFTDLGFLRLFNIFPVKWTSQTQIIVQVKTNHIKGRRGGDL